MPDPTTPNLGLSIPLNGADVGAWDVPCNANFNLLDSLLGGAVSVTLSNVPVTLSPTQYNPNLITFSGTLTADVVVTLPAVGRFYTFYNACTANTSFKVTTWISSLGAYTALPPNEPTTVVADGTNVRFVGLGPIGSELLFGGSAVPAWITGSSPPPFLNEDGSTFSAVTYPTLASYLGGTTLPDSKGRFRANLNQASGRLTGTSTAAGLDGNTLLAGGGSQTVGRVNLPNYSLPVTDPTHTHGVADPSHTHPVTDPGHNHPAPFGVDYTIGPGSGIGFPSGLDFLFDQVAITANAVTGIAINANYTGISNIANGTGVSVASGGSGTSYAPPAYVGGLTLIRAG